MKLWQSFGLILDCFWKHKETANHAFLVFPPLPLCSPSPIRPHCSPLSPPQCLAVATVISFKLLQKKKEKKNTKASSHHLPWKTQAQLYISLCCNPSVRLQPWEWWWCLSTGTPVLAHPALHPLNSLKDSRRKWRKEAHACTKQKDSRHSPGLHLCVAAASYRPSVQYGGVTPEPWAQGGPAQSKVCSVC